MFTAARQILLLFNKKIIDWPFAGASLWDPDAAVFTSGTYNWVANGTNTIANVDNSLQITYVNNNTGARETLNNSEDLSSDLTVGVWYMLSIDTKINTSYTRVSVYNGSGLITLFTEDSPTFVTHKAVFRATTTDAMYLQLVQFGAGKVFYIDNLALSPLILSSLFRDVVTSSADTTISANLTWTVGTQAGVVLNMNDVGSPSNFVIAYLDGEETVPLCKLDKCVAGVYTNVISGAFTYVPGATISVVKSGTDYTLSYNSIQVGATSTISDAGIISNPLFGKFRTYSGNTVVNLTV